MALSAIVRRGFRSTVARLARRGWSGAPSSQPHVIAITGSDASLVTITGSDAHIVVVLGRGDTTIAVAGEHSAVALMGSDEHSILLGGAPMAAITIRGSIDATTQIGGNPDMATLTNITIDIGADTTVVMTVAGTGTLTGTYRASIANRSNPSQSVLVGTPLITDAPGRVVTWTIADTDTENLIPGSNYEYGIWRADAGSEAPYAYGHCILQDLPGR